MTGARRLRYPLPRTGGFSLIELMVALPLGLFLVAGVIATFLSVGNANRSQQKLARVLENGRYGAQRITEELRMTGAQYCASYANSLPNSHGLNAVRPMFVNVANASMRPQWLPAPSAGNTAPYAIDPAVFARGYECNAAGSCTPPLPVASADINDVPAFGTTAGTRAGGTDVLTIRYLSGIGVSIAANAGDSAPIDVGTTANQPPLDLASGDLGLIVDCNAAEIFVAQPQGAAVTHSIASGNYAADLAASFSRSQDARVFNFTRDFLSVTYYVGLKDDVETPGRLISSIYRIENGGTPQEVVEGVERLDFRYVVADGSGGVHHLTANQVQSNAGGLACPPVAMTVPAGDPGCLWRAVQGIETTMLINSVRDDGPGSEPFRYSGSGSAFQALAPGTVLPSGLPAGRMIRREFAFLATVHNYSR